MSDIDPFTKRVADVYDSSGSHIATVRGGPSALAKFIGVMALIALPIIGVSIGFVSVKNFVVYGKLTPDTLEAQLHDNADNPTYFSDRARDAQMSIVMAPGPTDVPPERQPDVSWQFSVTNGSGDEHSITVKGPVVRVLDRGNPVEVRLDCFDNFVSDGIKFPPGTMGPFHFLLCSDVPGVDPYAVLTGPGEVVEQPSIIRIDGLPVTGGPPNTNPDVPSG